MAHRKLRKSGAIVASGAALIGVGGAALGVGAGAAGAATTVSAISLAPSGAAPTSLLQNSTGPVQSLTFTIQGASVGDKVSIDIAPPGLTSNPSDATRQVSWAALAAQPVTVVYEGAPPAGQTGPQFAVSESHSSADAPAVSAALMDQLNLTVTAAATDASTYTVYLGAAPTYAAGSLPAQSAPFGAGPAAGPLQVTTSASTPLGPLATTASLTPAGSATSSTLTIASPATVVSGQVVANQPSVAVPTSGASAFPVSNVVYTETAAGQLGAGATAAAPATITLAIAPVGPCVAATPCAFTGSPSVAVSSGSAAAVGPASVVGGAVQFKIYSPSTLAPASYTISGLKVSAPGAHPTGAILATLNDSINGAPPGAAAPFQIAGFANPPAPVAGADRDGTAIAALEKRYNSSLGNCVPNGAVVLARDDNYPDALAASFLARYLNTGILLTPSGALSSETQTELKNQGVSTVYIVGGPAAISSSTESTIDNLPVYACGGASAVALNTNVATVRVAGADRYATAAAVALYPKSLPASNYIDLSNAVLHGKNYNDTSGAESTVPPGVAQNTAIIASGTNYPDAVAASTPSYWSGLPILLTDPNSLSSATSSALQSLGIKQVVLMGGPSAVSDTVANQLMSTSGLGMTVIRVAGQDRTDTAQLLAHFSVDNLGMTLFDGAGTVWLARGDNYPDALTASSYLGAVGTPLLLTADPNTLGTYLTTYLNGAGAAGATQANAFGGPLAVAPATISAADAAIAAK